MSKESKLEANLRGQIKILTKMVDFQQKIIKGLEPFYEKVIKEEK